MSEKTIDKWSEVQIKYAAFLSRDKTTIAGVRKSNADFAKANGIGEATLYRWKMQEGFMQLVFDMTMKEMIDDLPKMTKAVKASVLGQELSYTNAKGKTTKLKPANVQAYLALMRQSRLLQADKQDHTTNGKDLPTPVLPIGNIRESD